MATDSRSRAQADPAFSGNPIYVVEPHSDDAFLSLGWSVRRWANEGREVVVVTVYSADGERAREAERWAKSVGAGWVGLGFEARGAVTLKPADDEVPPLPTPLLPEAMMAGSACRIWPLGFWHAEHAAVADTAPPGDLHYLDTPYQLDLYAQPKLRRALVGRTIEWWLHPPRKKWDAATIFESQAVLFEYFPPSRLESVAEIVVR